MEIRCVKGMYMLKLVSSEKNSGFKGLKTCTVATICIAISVSVVYFTL